MRFHTQDVASASFAAVDLGSGLKSMVMWDPESQVKFATNEPLRPHFRESQIYKFVEDNEGPGVQHVAFNVTDILGDGRGAEAPRRRVHGHAGGVLPRSARAASRRSASHNVREELALLEKHRVLLDGSRDAYMLQIFLREARALYSDERAGPFFYEIIQRCGDQGFGYGNFRALFESIERAQERERRQRGPTRRGRPMIDRHRAGILPDKPHTAYRAPDGKLLYEEMLTRGGFGGAFSYFYHRFPVGAHRDAGLSHRGWRRARAGPVGAAAPPATPLPLGSGRAAAACSSTGAFPSSSTRT